MAELGSTDQRSLRFGSAESSDALENDSGSAMVRVFGASVAVVADGGDRGPRKRSSDAVFGGFEPAPGTVEEVLEAVQRSNEALFEAAATSAVADGGAEQDGSASTSVAVVALVSDADADAEGADQVVCIARVGDAAIFVVGADGQACERVSNRFELAHGRSARGVLPAAQIVRSRRIGTSGRALTDAVVLEARSGDRVIMCSAGIAAVVDESTIREVATTISDLGECARALVAKVPEHEGRLAAIVLEVAPTVIDAAASPAASGMPSPLRLISGSARVLDEAAGEPRLTPSSGSSRPRPDADVPIASGMQLGKPMLLFFALVVLSLGMAWMILQQVSNDNFYVGFDADTVAVFRGTPGGDHEVFERSTIKRNDLSLADVKLLTDGVMKGSADEAITYMSSLRPSATAGAGGADSGGQTEQPSTPTPPSLLENQPM